MKPTKAKNFQLPVDLHKKWNEFLPGGPRTGSPNAAGALLLWMKMPAHIREAAMSLAVNVDADTAIDKFWDHIWMESRELNSAINVLRHASTLEHERLRLDELNITDEEERRKVVEEWRKDD